MNSFSGHITGIRTHDALALVTVRVDPHTFEAIVIDDPETSAYLRTNSPVQVQFKETEVIITTAKAPVVSLRNRIEGHISAIEKGRLLSRLTIQTAIGNLVSIISTDAAVELGLEKNSPVTAMVKLNEIILAP
ncbi:TOBE domain-containing protein [Sinomicrobium oceani]|uniref:TOBE domain-containing protein n=1 Tax=Sinomicrobium oceani TaxID=1150368 RepID=A0A1K1R4B2_9FLAO|nr:TOBE domain-containing protein [Sinomicrobium oceani]SFW66691.1 TOBE domain-containing protein [Sinomicrobium oceani]